MLANANLALAKRIGQPAGNDRHNPLVVPNVRLVHAWHRRVADFVRDDAEQVAGDGPGVEVEHPLLKIRHALAQFLRRRALNLHGPPFAIKTEPHGWPLAAPRWGAGSLVHLI